MSGSGSPNRLKSEKVNMHLSDAFENFKTRSSLLLGKFLHNQPNPFFRHHLNQQQQPFDPLSIRILSSKKKIPNAFEVTTTKVFSSRSNGAANLSNGFGQKSRKNSDPHVNPLLVPAPVGAGVLSPAGLFAVPLSKGGVAVVDLVTGKHGRAAESEGWFSGFETTQWIEDEIILLRKLEQDQGFELVSVDGRKTAG